MSDILVIGLGSRYLGVHAEGWRPSATLGNSVFSKSASFPPVLFASLRPFIIMSLAFSHPVNPDDPGIKHTLLATTWTFTCVAIVFVLVRVYVRTVYARQMTLDDWVMVLALAIQLLYQSLLTVACERGFGMATENMTLEQYTQSHKYTFATEFPGGIVSLVARISIVILLIRIFGSTRRWFRWFLIGFTVLQAVAVLLNICFELAWMSPIKAHWDPTVTITREIDARYEEYSAMAWLFLFAFSDLAYVLFPASFIWKLHMPSRQRLGLVILMSVSLITFTAALLKIVISILDIEERVPTSFGQSASGIVWITAGIEQCLVIAMGCVPSLGPLARIQFPTWASIGETIASLIERTRKMSRSGSSWSSNRSNRSVYHDNIELGPKVLISDEIPGGSSPAFLKSTSATAFAYIKAHKNDNTLSQSGIHHTAEYGVTYGSRGDMV